MMEERATDGVKGVIIKGAIGFFADQINGVYRYSSPSSSYRKIGCDEQFLEYRAGSREWQVLSSKDPSPQAYCSSPTKCHPTSTTDWQISFAMNSYESQHIEIETADEDDMENANIVTATASIALSGASPPFAKLINGVYEPTVELSCGASVYRKVCDSNCRIEYNSAAKQWQLWTVPDELKSSSSQTQAQLQAQSQLPIAACTVPIKCTLDTLIHAPALWSVKTHPNSTLVPCATIRLAIATAIEVDAARVIIATTSVGVSGVAGNLSSTLNGMYTPTSALSWGVSVYSAVEAPHACLVYWAPTSRWLIQTPSDQGTDKCHAWCPVTSKCLPERAPPTAVWSISGGNKPSAKSSDKTSGKGYSEQPAVTVYAVRSSTPWIKISGAVGSLAAFVNGMYEPTAEYSGGVAVYKKTDDNNTWLEFWASTRRWQIKLTADKGQNKCWGYCPVQRMCAPEACPMGSWLMTQGGVMVVQETMAITAEAEEKNKNITSRMK